MRASHILLQYNAPWPPDRMQIRRTRAEALSLGQELTQRIRDGEALGDLARQHSDCPSRMRGGDLGTFKRGQMVKLFEQAVLRLEVGEVSDPVHTEFGFHVIQRTA